MHAAAGPGSGCGCVCPSSCSCFWAKIRCACKCERENSNSNNTYNIGTGREFVPELVVSTGHIPQGTDSTFKFKPSGDSSYLTHLLWCLDLLSSLLRLLSLLSLLLLLSELPPRLRLRWLRSDDRLRWRLELRL